MAKRVKVKRSDLPKIDAWIKANVKPAQQAAAWALVDAGLGSFIKMEKKYGYDFYLEAVQAVTDLPVHTEPEPEPEPVNGPQLMKVWARGSRLLGFSVSAGMENWPVKVMNGKPCVAIIRCNGKKFEWLSQENLRAGSKSVENLYHGKYRQGIALGDSVRIDITDVHGKRPTNALPFAWPWANT